jgi:septal ring factor EnvC (AmiA/AmiB activator)
MMKGISKHIAVVLLVFGALIISSCSSSPSDEDKKALADLKAQVASLEGQVTAMQRDNAGLQKQIADKNAKLQQCQSDQDAVKKGMGK